MIIAFALYPLANQMQVVLQIVILDENGFAPSILSTIFELKGRKAKTYAGLPEAEDAGKRQDGLKG